MAGIIKALCVIFFLALMSQGTLQQRTLRDLKINQKATGRTVKGKTEWNATVSNNCICTQSQVKLTCENFRTVEPINPRILSKSGDLCLLNNGSPIYGEYSVSFAYAWQESYFFKPISSEIACS